LVFWTHSEREVANEKDKVLEGKDERVVKQLGVAVLDVLCR